MKRILFCIVVALAIGSCTKGDYSMVPVKSNRLGDTVVIDPPCNYDDAVYLSIFPQPDLNVYNTERYDNIDNSEYAAHLYQSSMRIVIRYTGPTHKIPQKSEVVDLATNREYEIFGRMTGNDTYEAVSGMLYVDVKANRDIEFTWCNVKMTSGNFYMTAHGNFTVKK